MSRNCPNCNHPLVDTGNLTFCPTCSAALAYVEVFQKKAEKFFGQDAETQQVQKLVIESQRREISELKESRKTEIAKLAAQLDDAIPNENFIQSTWPSSARDNTKKVVKIRNDVKEMIK